MKEKLSSSKKNLLMGSSLDEFHNESREWINTIAFWKDEAKFFANLLDEDQVNASEYGQMLQYLEKIHVTLFDYLAEDIIAHEKLLSRLMGGEKGTSEQDYREQHIRIKEQMDLFINDFKEFKKMVLAYAKKL
jgi:hypothetical protein